VNNQPPEYPVGDKPAAGCPFDRFVVGLLHGHESFAAASDSAGLGERHFPAYLRPLFSRAKMGPRQVQDVLRLNRMSQWDMATLRAYVNSDFVVPADSAMRWARQIVAQVEAARRVPIADIVPLAELNPHFLVLADPCFHCGEHGVKIERATGAVVCSCSTCDDFISFISFMIHVSYWESVEFLASPHQQFIRGLISENAKFAEAARAIGLDGQHFPGPLRLSFILAMAGPERVRAVIAGGKYDEYTRAFLKRFGTCRNVKLSPDVMALAKRIVEEPAIEGRAAALGGRGASQRNAVPVGQVRDNKALARWYQRLFEDLEPKKVTSNDHTVGVAIGRHVNKATGEAFPGFSTLAKKTGLSVNTVRASVERLVAAGHLRIKPSKPLVFIPLLYLVDDPHGDDS
jgi:hypothetical protein